MRGVGLLAVLLLAVAVPHAGARQGGESPPLAPVPPGLRTPRLVAAPPDSVPEVDVTARIEAFQRDFVEDFGGRIDRGTGEAPRREDLGARIERRLAERFEGSSLERWYRRALGLYRGAEGVYERIEAATEWAATGFDLDADLESVVDGKVAVHVERRVHGFDLGLDVEDAVEGKVGLRLSGVIRGYKISLDAGDVGSGRVAFRLKKRLE